MSIATVVTRGYGTFGSIANVVTRGYGSFGAAATLSRLVTEIVADIDRALFSNSEFETAITIDGDTVYAIVYDDSEDQDARAPRLFVAQADVDGYEAGAVVVVNGTTYAAAGYYPDGFGGAIIQLQP